MDILVHTGQSKSSTGTFLAPLSFKSAQGEQVLLLLQIEASTTDAKALEKEATNVVQHALLETEGDAASRLDGTLKELNGLLKGLLVSQTLEDIHAIIAIVDQHGVLHASHAGRAEAYVVRGGTASQITEYTRGKPTPAFVYIASGALEPRDVVIFSTQRLLRAVTPAQLTQIAQRGDQVADEIIVMLESEKEQAAIAVVHAGKSLQKAVSKEDDEAPVAPIRERGSDRRRARSSGGVAQTATAMLSSVKSMAAKGVPALKLPELGTRGKDAFTRFAKDLKDPKRKRRAHLLLLAGTLATFLVVWAVVQLSLTTERSKTREELEVLVGQIDDEIRTAENRRLTGDVDAANAILQRAEERAKQVMDNESGLFRVEALDLLERIRGKREEINNIVRLSPRVVANLAGKNPDITAQGFIGLSDGEFVVYDRQDLYRVLLNSVEEPERITGEELILMGVSFDRFQTLLFQTTGNAMIEMISSEPVSMKTEDPAGWILGKSMAAYLRFLYVLSPENGQIYKYERLANRYSAPAEYNVNGDLTNALDIAIDGNVYVLKEGGEVVKLLRGETQPFVIRHAPEGALADATQIFKVVDGNTYFLDPVHARVIVITDGGATGESSYLKQYVLEGDQMGELKDLYVDPDETRLYVLDDKRVYVVDLGAR